jgi:mRNA interferase MazF
MEPSPARGEIWLVQLDPVRGHEQAGTRPCLVLSSDWFNRGPAGLVVLLPMTTRDRRIPLHVAVDPVDSGLPARSFVKCDNLRAVARERLVKRLGQASGDTLAEIEDRVRVLLEL